MYIYPLDKVVINVEKSKHFLSNYLYLCYNLDKYIKDLRCNCIKGCIKQQGGF